MTQYQVDNTLMAEYIKSFNIRRSYMFFIVTAIIISMQTYIVYKRENDFHYWISIIIVAIISVAFFFGLKLANDKLKLFVSGQYFIDNSLLKFQAADNFSREFRLEEIAIIHKKSYGTIIVKGSGWTKLDYIRPKRTSYQVNGLNVIFIPTITSNYTDLIREIKQTANNALKLGTN